MISAVADGLPGTERTEATVEGPGDATMRILHDIEKQDELGKIRIRTSLQLFDSLRRTYVGWADQNWKIDVAGTEQAKKFRQGMELLFDLFGSVGVDRAVAELEMLKGAILRQQSNNT